MTTGKYVVYFTVLLMFEVCFYWVYYLSPYFDTIGFPNLKWRYISIFGTSFYLNGNNVRKIFIHRLKSAATTTVNAPKMFIRTSVTSVSTITLSKKNLWR